MLPMQCVEIARYDRKIYIKKMQEAQLETVTSTESADG